MRLETMRLKCSTDQRGETSTFPVTEPSQGDFFIAVMVEKCGFLSLDNERLTL